MFQLHRKLVKNGWNTIEFEKLRLVHKHWKALPDCAILLRIIYFGDFVTFLSIYIFLRKITNIKKINNSRVSRFFSVISLCHLAISRNFCPLTLFLLKPKQNILSFVIFFKLLTSCRICEKNGDDFWCVRSRNTSKSIIERLEEEQTEFCSRIFVVNQLQFIEKSRLGSSVEG